MNADQIVRITLDESTVLARGEHVERERAAALHDLSLDSLFRPLRATSEGQAGPWSLDLKVIDGRLVLELCDGQGCAAGVIGLGLARFRRVVREYFAICDSYYLALRKASAQELETLDMARKGLHDRGARRLQEALEGKAETDFATARRLFTLICVLHIRG